MCYHVINFGEWEDFVRGLNIAANNGSVECQPHRTLVVTYQQLEAIKVAGLKYGNGPKTSRKSF
jgi:hypothetical protein